MNYQITDTICALATPAGPGAIAVIRLSGNKAFEIGDAVFFKKKTKSEFQFSKAKSHTIHFGDIKDGDKIIDEVLIAIFKNPHSYTGEDTLEISCHGSVFIQQQIIKLLIAKGARMAEPGEFTLRAFLNGKLDLSQAEAVADLIASDSEASHQMAIQQMRGGFSKDIAELREKLINFAALIELELDFSEEDIEFANRNELRNLIENLRSRIKKLIDSFAAGNVFKNGVPVAIIGKPNAGKSTLLNTLLNEDRAIVSDIAGTTRDTIEEEINLNGVIFRFIDTAGIRNTADKVEAIGIEKTYEKISKAALVLYIFDVTNDSPELVKEDIQLIQQKTSSSNIPIVIVGNKIDVTTLDSVKEKFTLDITPIYISAKNHLNIDELKEKLLSLIDTGILKSNQTIVSNARHLDALNKSLEALDIVLNGLDNHTTGDFLALDIRKSLHHLGEITGAIDVDKDILGTIFSKFCIGK
ncbi:MAG: tRNA uridine-5-carboxymethylaminomethyl(34) synthesis GTPase MnmE, partial [Bacteroidia bacterium]